MVSPLENSQQTRRFLVAPDSFKGTFDAPAVAWAIGAGLEQAGAAVDLCPVADGGEGTAAVLRAALGGEARGVAAHDPLGREIEAEFVLLGDGETAAVDTAAASGLPLVAAAEQDAEAASTYGTGELIAAAVEAGAHRVILAAGGSASSDGGAGALEAIDERGGLGGAQIEVLCDVTTAFEDAARVFAPQKGADADAVERLSERLQRLAAELPRDPRGVPKTGCAGGLSGGLWAAFDAELRPGANYLLELLGFERRLGEADAAISGEGRIDPQSLEGKVVGQIARVCARLGKDLHVVVGRDELDRGLFGDLPIRSIREAGTLEALTAAGRGIGDPHHLQRFVDAQDRGGTYEQALAELRAGRKTSHWIWFVFPQIAGLGQSPMSQKYAITSLDEARAYLDHPVLGPRLRECAEAMLSPKDQSATEILGEIDAVKLRSSMTLFVRAAPDEPLFGRVLDAFFDGAADARTLARAGLAPGGGDERA